MKKILNLPNKRNYLKIPWVGWERWARNGFVESQEYVAAHLTARTITPSMCFFASVENLEKFTQNYYYKLIKNVMKWQNNDMLAHSLHACERTSVCICLCLCVGKNLQDNANESKRLVILQFQNAEIRCRRGNNHNNSRKVFCKKGRKVWLKVLPGKHITATRHLPARPFRFGLSRSDTIRSLDGIFYKI